uniref:Uncharacterized protein n=1 Tax=viral metagenome TaxID=1070528 RepID=A0A6C0EDF5_9ZZZZ
MTDKTTILKAFNSHFFDFLADIIRVFPDNQDLAVAKTSFETIKKANPTIILKAWKAYVYSPYKEVIDGGDITYFLEKDYSSDLSILANSGEIMKIIDKLRQPIKEMDAVNKEHSIKYIQNLSKLSMLYV